jgi:teichuronic acid biosynthesis glycosyltransferase TuaG
MDAPLISIIMPAYNASEFILETLESVKKQTYTNWEIILVNDCSTDDTVKKANDFSKQVSNNVKVITNKKNLGASACRNGAVANASGKWLALLDSDDIWLPEHLETLINTISKDSNIKMAYSGCLVFREQINNIIYKQEISDEMLNNFNMSLYTHQIGINPCTVMIDIELWKSIGGLDLKLKNAEDKDFFLNVAKFGAKYSYTGVHTALYRKHKNAKSNNSAQMALAAIYIYEKYFDWESIPLKIRKSQLANAHLSYARLIKHDDIKKAYQHTLKAFKIKKSFKNLFHLLLIGFLTL